LQNLSLFGVGLPLGLAMIGGWIYAIIRNVRRPRAAELIVLVYVVPYFAITGDFYAKFLRYMLPITPFLAMFAALGLIRLIDLAHGWRIAALHPELASAGPAMVRLPPEFVPESPGDDRDLADLRHFDGDGATSTSHVGGDPARPNGDGGRRLLASQSSPATNGHVALDPATVSAGWSEGLDPDLRRRAELKGLALRDLIGGVGPRPVGDAQRIAQTEGRSPDWFAEDRADGGAVVALPSAATEMGDERAFRADGWVEVPSDDEPDPDAPTPTPLPAWLARFPSVAAFASGRGPTWLARSLAAFVLAFTAFYGLAFDHMYDRLSPPVSASEWLYQNAPRGAVIATEHWEEGMPVPLQTSSGQLDAGSEGYQIVTMPMYDDDNAQKLGTIVNNLEQADYVVFFSNRLYGTVPRIPARYPMSRRYYEDLFGGKLGFQLVDVGERYPNLLGVAFVDNTLADPGLPVPLLIQHDRIAPITIDLGHADESFSVYDHQRVLIFQKTQKLTPDQLAALIGPPPAPGTTAPTGQVAQYKSLLLTPAQEALVQAGGTFGDQFNRGDLLNRFPLAVWVLVILLVGLGGFPFGFLALRFLPDRGYLLSRTLGTLMFVWLSWVIVSLGLVEATRPVTLAILFVFLALALGAAYLQRDQIAAFVRAHRRLLLAEEGVFWLAFLYDLWIRAQDPDLWHPVLGGEKPMDLAYYTAAARSPIYPPYDPWFAGATSPSTTSARSSSAP
jgi:hypothetical protein